ncbi:MAG: hypothetical protein WD490_07160 [Opitutales bacterium]
MAEKAASPQAAPGPVSVEQRKKAEPEELLPEIASYNKHLPDVEEKLIQVWKSFQAIGKPSIAKMDDFLNQLMALPPESVNWGEVMHVFGRAKYPELIGPFRRIAEAVPHVEATDMRYFYWAAVKEFIGADDARFLPEVASGCRRLDVDTYDIDVLDQIMDLLLVSGFDLEVLELAEHFLPIVREDDGLIGGADGDWADFIYELRVGKAIRFGEKNPLPEAVSADLVRDIEDDIAPEMVHEAAAAICEAKANWKPERAAFQLVDGCISEDPQAWRDCLRLCGALIKVAREAWEFERHSPGSAYRSLCLTLASVYRWKWDRAKKGKKCGENLLDFLHLSGLERRVIMSSRDFIGVKTGRALLLLEGHGLLLRFAVRHNLIAPGDAGSLEREIQKLKKDLKPSA